MLWVTVWVGACPASAPSAPQSLAAGAERGATQSTAGRPSDGLFRWASRYGSHGPAPAVGTPDVMPASRGWLEPSSSGGVEAASGVAAPGVPPSQRYKGSGGPLVCESWRFRPAGAGWVMGMIQGGTLIDDWVIAEGGFFGGYRLGWDCGHYWGYEMRLAFGNLALSDSHRARQAQQAADDEKGFEPTDPFRDRFDARRDATTTLWDMSLLYYPWGDATWRPYLAVGMGLARLKFIDRLSIPYDECMLGVPIGLGVKYRAGPRLALRLELADNIGFASSFNTVHHLTFTGGLELRFGGSRVAYWPWEPGRHYW